MRVVAGDHVLDPRRVVEHAHERLARVETAQRLDRALAVERLRELRLHGRVNAAGERARVRDEGELEIPARRRARERADLRRVAVGEGVVGIQVAVPLRVVRAGDRAPARAGRARHRGHEHRPVGEAEREERHRREQRGGGEAAGMRHVRRGRAVQVLGHRAGELLRPRGRSVRVPVDALVFREIGIAVIGRDVDHGGIGAGCLGLPQDRVDQRVGDAVRRGREHGGARLARHDVAGIRDGDVTQVPAGGREVREGLRDRLARLAVGGDRHQLEARMREREAQQFAGHVAGAAQDHGRRLRAHSDSSREWATASRPTAVITRSPSAAPLVMALNAGTPSCSRMMSTPTELSVDGPVTTAGSMPKRSRSSFTPPQAATGSLAESTTAVSACRMSGASRMASTP